VITDAGLLTIGEQTALAGAIARGLVDAAEAVRLDRAAMARIALMVGQGSFGTDATIGFVDGFAQGFLAGGVVWKDEVLAYLRILGVGVTLGAAEFFYRPIVEEGETTGLSKQVRAELETLRSLQALRPVLQWLDEVGPAEAIEVLREMLPSADDLATMIGRAAQKWATTWLTELIATAPDAVAAGRHIGKLVGRVAIELVRGFLEPPVVSAQLMAASIVSDLEGAP